MTTLYVAGPMTGLPDFNYPAFHDAERQLREAGFDVLNPARPYHVEPKTWQGYMARALHDVACSDGLALLPGCHNSRGARLEITVAYSLGLDVRAVDDWLAEAVSA